MKNSSDIIGNRIRDLPACSAMPNELRHRLAPYNVDDRGNYCVCSFGGMKQCKTEYSKICLSYTFMIPYDKP